MKWMVGLICLMASQILLAQSMNSQDLLKKSMAYHDPDGQWASLNAIFQMKQETPDKPVRKSTVKIDLTQGFFEITREVDGVATVRGIKNDACSATVDGKEPSEKQIEELRLSCEQIKNYQNYYLYLLGLPMKLQDKGTNLSPEATVTTFMGKSCWQLKVTYSEEVGKDTWYFYMNPQNFALLGCRFYHDESKNDGEYIVFEEEAIFGSMKFPKKRTWYMNIDDKNIGVDTIVNIE